jgi:RsiW-degrading membrane proteinase PrsW (M82 family)
MPGIILPIAVLAWVAIGGLPAGSWRRLWASFGIGMIGSTLGALAVEYSLVAVAALAAGAIASLNPEWLAILEKIKSQLSNAGDIQAIITSLAPYLNNPLVFILALLFAAVIAPIIEETLKPAAIWVLGKRLHSPAEGFALGATCGAGFALLEGTLAATGFAQMPGVGLASRAASSLLHITASGLVGWGIASSRVEGRHGRLAGAFLASTSLHGLWNGAVVLAVFGSLRLTLADSMPDPIGILLVVLGIVMLIALLIGITSLLPIINHRLKPATFSAVSSEQSDIIAQLQP